MSKSCLIFGLFLILVGFSSCRPRGVLSRGDMVDILYDLHLAQALVGSAADPIPNEWRLGMKDLDFRDMAYQSVLRKHDVDEETFYASVSYYSKHLQLYSKIYADVDKRLQDLHARLNQFHYIVPTVGDYRAHMHFDTAQVYEWFNIGRFKPDTTSVKSFVSVSDSILSYGAWFACQYLSPIRMDTTLFSIIPKMKAHSVADSIAIANHVTNQADTVAKKELDAIQTIRSRDNVRDAESRDPEAIRKRLREKYNSGK